MGDACIVRDGGNLKFQILARHKIPSLYFCFCTGSLESRLHTVAKSKISRFGRLVSNLKLKSGFIFFIMLAVMGRLEASGYQIAERCAVVGGKEGADALPTQISAAVNIPLMRAVPTVVVNHRIRESQNVCLFIIFSLQVANESLSPRGPVTEMRERLCDL